MGVEERYCFSCGARVPETAAFCPNCGRRLDLYFTSKPPQVRLKPRLWSALALAGFIIFASGFLGLAVDARLSLLFEDWGFYLACFGLTLYLSSIVMRGRRPWMIELFFLAGVALIMLEHVLMFVSRVSSPYLIYVSRQASPWLFRPYSPWCWPSGKTLS